MRIAHCITELNLHSGGPVRAIIDLSNALVAKGHEVRVLSYDITDAPEDWGGEGRPEAIRLPAPSGPMRHFTASQMGEVRAGLKGMDVVHVHGIWEPPIAQIARTCELMKTPYVVSIRGMLDDWCMAQRALKKKIYLALSGSRLLNNAARVHLTAQAELDQARRYFPRSEPVVIPNLIDLEPYRDPPPPDAARDAFDAFKGGEPVLLFLSRIHYKKGIEILIRASKLLEDRGVGHRVIVAGSGEQAYIDTLNEQIRAENAGCIELVGPVFGDDKISLYSAADLFVLPTSQENFGFVFFEAMAAGTHVLTTKGVDTWPEIEASGGGTIIELHDDRERTARDLADRCEALIADREALARSGGAAKDWVFENLNPDVLVQKFEAMYTAARPGA